MAFLNFRKSLLLILIAWTIMFNDLITFEYTHICHDERRPDLYGFPMIYKTDIPWVNSFSGELYMDGLIVNFLFWLIIILGIAWLTRNLIIKNRILQKTMIAAQWIFICLSILWVLLEFTVIHWRINDTNNFDMKCYRRELKF